MRIVVVFLALVHLAGPAVAPALAGMPATTSVVLSVGRGPGAAGSQWYVALWVRNCR